MNEPPGSRVAPLPQRGAGRAGRGQRAEREPDWGREGAVRAGAKRLPPLAFSFVSIPGNVFPIYLPISPPQPHDLESSPSHSPLFLPFYPLFLCWLELHCCNWNPITKKITLKNLDPMVKLHWPPPWLRVLNRPGFPQPPAGNGEPTTLLP